MCSAGPISPQGICSKRTINLILNKRTKSRLKTHLPTALPPPQPPPHRPLSTHLLLDKKENHIKVWPHLSFSICRFFQIFPIIIFGLNHKNCPRKNKIIKPKINFYKKWENWNINLGHDKEMKAHYNLPTYIHTWILFPLYHYYNPLAREKALDFIECTLDYFF
jgi:hypothetical protein